MQKNGYAQIYEHAFVHVCPHAYYSTCTFMPVCVDADITHCLPSFCIPSVDVENQQKHLFTMISAQQNLSLSEQVGKTKVCHNNI